MVRSHIPNDPLVGNLYAGQAVRPCGKLHPTAENLANRRWKEEDNDAKRGNGSDLSFLEVLRFYGPGAFDNEVVWQTKGPRWQVQELADEKEVVLIAENGGTLRDLATDVHIKQTFNRQTGGKALKQWYHRMHGVFTLKRQRIFKAAMEAYVAQYHSALVPQTYVSPDGYRLGSMLGKFRSGAMRTGCSNKSEMEQWAEKLPNWSWNAQKTEEFRQLCAKNVKTWMQNESLEAKIDRKKREHITKAKKSDEEKANTRKKTKATVDAKTEEQKAESKRKRHATDKTTESIAKRSKAAKANRSRELRNELLRARSKVVPFENDYKKRIAMKLKSEDFSGRGKCSVLYMLSFDGRTIQRVNTRGQMSLVGPVVDPEPPDAFDSEAELLG